MEVPFELERIDCPICGVIQFYPKNLISIKKQNGTEFYCANQHKLLWPKPAPDSPESVAEELKNSKEEIKRLKSENLQLLHKLEQMEGKMSS